MTFLGPLVKCFLAPYVVKNFPVHSITVLTLFYPHGILAGSIYVYSLIFCPLTWIPCSHV
jgi:hypothetical protein